MNRTLLLDMKMLAEDNAPQSHELIQEGLKYFKTSSRIQRAIIKAEYVFNKGKSKLQPDEVRKVEHIINRMKEAKKEFANVENSYSTGLSKDVAMKKFKLLKTKYIDIYKDITLMRNILVGSGIFLALGTAAFLMLRFVFPDVAPDLVGISKDEQVTNKMHKIFNDGTRSIDDSAKNVENFFNKFKSNPKGLLDDIGSSINGTLDKLKGNREE